MKKETQFNAVLQLFKEGKTLNWLNAFKLTGCSSVGRRLSDFTKLGYVFKKERVVFSTKFGTKGSYMNYTLDRQKTPKHLL